MTQIDSDAALLAVTLIGRDGKRRCDSQSKRRLIEACLQLGVSVAGLALKAGANTNLLRRWIKLHQERNGVAATSEVVENAPPLAVPSAFVDGHDAQAPQCYSRPPARALRTHPRSGDEIRLEYVSQNPGWLAARHMLIA
ncbi:Transposase [Burkholderia sp. D7]|nr:Transposase [Burkholderia sp. D7]